MRSFVYVTSRSTALRVCSSTSPGTFCIEEDARLQTYVAGLDQAALVERLGMVSCPRWLILAHVVNHGTRHRSELARYLTDCRHSPGDIDLLDVLDLP